MELDLTSIYSIIISIITVLGSAGAWKFYERRALKKEKTETIITDDYRDRVEKLEESLRILNEENKALNSKILELTSESSRLKVKVEFLERENQALMIMKSH